MTLLQVGCGLRNVNRKRAKELFEDQCFSAERRALMRQLRVMHTLGRDHGDRNA